MASILGIGGGTISAGEAGEVDVKSPPAGAIPPEAVIDQKLLDKQGALERQINDKDAAFEKKLGNYRTRSERQSASTAHSESMAGLRDQLKDINKQIADERTKQVDASRESQRLQEQQRLAKERAERPLTEKFPWLAALPVLGGVYAGRAAYALVPSLGSKLGAASRTTADVGQVGA